jgi:hypothetical protein
MTKKIFSKNRLEINLTTKSKNFWHWGGAKRIFIIPLEITIHSKTKICICVSYDDGDPKCPEHGW